MRSKKILSAAMSLCMALPMLAVQSPASVSADVTLMGDANGDGEFNVADAVMTQKWLVGNGSITNWENVDFYKDGVIDSFDLALLCKELVKQQGIELPPEFLAINLSKDVKSNEVSGANADSEFVMGQTEFALELMKREIKDDTNTLISPYSIMQALAMTANGADGETKAQMEKVLGGMSIEKLNEYLYTQRISQSSNDISTANSIWTLDDEERISVYPDFLQKNADYFSADVFKAPFDDTTVKDINSWVNDKTDKMIPKLLDEIPDDAVMYLINAVAFDAKWIEPYEEYDVVDSYFTDYKGDVQTAKMMYSTEYSYLKGENAEGFLKYYKGKRYAFAAILPDEGIALSDYVNSLTPEELNRILANPHNDYITAGLPKFSYDFDTELSNTLIDMGMINAFNPIIADFTKMAYTASGYLSVSKVVHKTHIEVSEEGTKAAAVTSVEMSDGACAAPPEKEIILNRPFVYAIVDTETSLPIFLGTVGSIEQ